MVFFLICITSPTETKSMTKTKSRFISPSERVKAVTKIKIPLRDTLLEFGPIKVTAVDLWSVILPRELPTEDLNKIEKVVPAFKPGWLTDAVRTINYKCTKWSRYKMPFIYFITYNTVHVSVNVFSARVF